MRVNLSRTFCELDHATYDISHVTISRDIALQITMLTEHPSHPTALAHSKTTRPVAPEFPIFPFKGNPLYNQTGRLFEFPFYYPDSLQRGLLHFNVDSCSTSTWTPPLQRGLLIHLNVDSLTRRESKLNPLPPTEIPPLGMFTQKLLDGSFSRLFFFPQFWSK